MLRRIKAVGGRVRAVLFWQGEADAACRTPRSTYAALLRRLGDDVQQDCGAPLVAAQIGDYGPRYSGSAVDAVRLAQQSCWGTSNVLAGPVLYDIDLGGHIHFLAGGDVARAARRWTAAILEGVLSRPAARPPMLRSATWNGRRTIVLAVDPGIALLAPGPARGFVVRSGGRTVPVTAGVVRSNGTVQLTLSVAVTRPPTVSLGSGHSAAGADVPAEPSAWHLPMLMFVDRRVVIAAH
jgi:hypothetical protein